MVLWGRWNWRIDRFPLIYHTTSMSLVSLIGPILMKSFPLLHQRQCWLIYSRFSGFHIASAFLEHGLTPSMLNTLLGSSWFGSLIDWLVHIRKVSMHLWRNLWCSRRILLIGLHWIMRGCALNALILGMKKWRMTKEWRHVLQVWVTRTVSLTWIHWRTLAIWIWNKDVHSTMRWVHTGRIDRGQMPKREAAQCYLLLVVQGPLGRKIHLISLRQNLI